MNPTGASAFGSASADVITSLDDMETLWRSFWPWSEEDFHGAKLTALDGELTAFVGGAAEAPTIGADAVCIAIAIAVGVVAG